MSTRQGNLDGIIRSQRACPYRQATWLQFYVGVRRQARMLFDSARSKRQLFQGYRRIIGGHQLVHPRIAHSPWLEADFMYQVFG